MTPLQGSAWVARSYPGRCLGLACSAPLGLMRKQPFERSDHPSYRKTVRSLATLSRQAHGETKMENLFKWNAANLHYLVVEPGLVRDHEVPPGWAARKGWALGRG